MTLLVKTRKINAMLQESGGDSVNFKEMADKLSSVIEANVFIVSRKGKLLGFEIFQQIENDRMNQMFENRQFPEVYTQKLFEIRETSSNLDIESTYTAFPIENKDII